MKEQLQAQLVSDLVVESMEGLDQFDQDLLLLERGQATSDTLHSMFRILHTIKGTSGCLGFSRIERLAHAGENLLTLLRDGSIEPHVDMISTLLSSADALRGILATLASNGGGGECPADDSAIIADLHRLCSAIGRESAAAPPVVSCGLFADEDLEAAAPAPAAAAPPPSAPAVASDTSIRVDVQHLDNLMDLVGELVLSRNQIVQMAAITDDSALVSATQRLNHITSKLQESAMKTRMQPIGNVWSKFPRVVRDVSHELGKHVELRMEGSDTELDRTILEAIKDPLTHLVRNAIDHGFEAPEVRVQRGKKADGILLLRAFHEGGQVIIEVSDDGAGIDRDHVRAKALERGLLAPDQAERLSDRELLNLLFLPGFSTAERVTNLSGRGVGMDVVRRNIEKIGGNVDIHSEPGQGTIFRLKIPLTLAIVPALIISCAHNRYAVPQASLIELVHISADSGPSVEYVERSPVYRLRGHLLPLVYLIEQFGGVRDSSAQDSYLLVVQAEGKQFGLVVDSISDTEEIVVKPLGKELKSVSVYAGATIMGDGRVALILDVMGIARRSRVVEESGSGRMRNQAAAARADAVSDRQSLLLLAIGDNRSHRVAIPLETVARLEEFPASAIEQAGQSDVVQYRGDIMPLVHVGPILGLSSGNSRPDTIPVVVYGYHGRNVGLVVDSILDAVEDSVHLQRCHNRPGILGSAIIDKRVTDFLDMEALIRASGTVDFEAGAPAESEWHSS